MCVMQILLQYLNFLGQAAPVREVLPRLLHNQELQGKFAHPLKQESGWAKSKIDKARIGLGWVGDYRENVEEGDERCVTNQPG